MSPSGADFEPTLGERALPIPCRVEETEGAIDFVTQKDLLDVVREWLPKDRKVVLHADRFYGTAEMIGWRQRHGWDYRVRFKGNLTASLAGRTGALRR